MVKCRSKCQVKCRSKRNTFACGFSSDCSPQRSHIRAPPFRTAPPCVCTARPAFIGTYLHRHCFSEGRCPFTVPLPLLSVAAGLAQGKPPSGSDFKEHSWGKSLESCVTVEAGKVGDYGSYYRLPYSASAAAPLLAEYSKGSTSLCGGSPCGMLPPLRNAFPFGLGYPLKCPVRFRSARH